MFATARNQKSLGVIRSKQHSVKKSENKNTNRSIYMEGLSFSYIIRVLHRTWSCAEHLYWDRPTRHMRCTPGGSCLLWCFLSWWTIYLIFTRLSVEDVALGVASLYPILLVLTVLTILPALAGLAVSALCSIYAYIQRLFSEDHERVELGFIFDLF